MKEKSVENIAFNLLRYAKLFNYHFSWRPTEFGYSEVPINGYTRLSTIRGVVRGSAECAMAHPDFGRSVNPISTRLCPSKITTGTPGFSDLPTALPIDTVEFQINDRHH